MTKEERESGVEKTPILGNVKVFYSEELAAQPAPQPASQQAKPDSTTFADLEEIPF